MLQLKNIVKRYHVGESDITALAGVSLSFRESEFVSVLGPSGCGKTTLLNIIGGLDRYTSGDLIINGISTRQYKDSDWDAYRNHSIGFVFQSYNLIPHQTVLSNVELALTLSGVGKSERRRRAIEALEKVGLGDQLSKKPNQMSGGQMQRVAIARALVNNPDILLADEPTGALDTATSVQIMDLLKEISAARLVIMVTHNPELAETYSSRIVSLRDGVIVGDTAPYTEEAADRDAARLRAEKPAEGAAKPVEGVAEPAEGVAKPAEGVAKPAENAAEPATRPSKKTPKRKKKKETSMSFLTALSLSLNNLMTKKGRTFMTSFAGSIGIIGIALILALSTGVQSYINAVQKDTLSAYPIMIQNEEMDLAAVMGSMAETALGREPHGTDAVYADSGAYEMFNALFSQETKKNNLRAFKAWIEKEFDPKTATTKFSEYASAVHYQYDVPLNIYVLDESGKYVSTALSDALGAENNQVSVSSPEEAFGVQMSASISSVNLWEEILPGRDGNPVSDMIRSQFDLVYGKWPENAQELVLVMDEKNEVNDFTFYALGKLSGEELRSIMSAAMAQTPIETENRVMSYEEITKVSFKLILNTDRYTDPDGDGVWSYIGDDEARMELIIKNGLDLHICGIVKPAEDASSTALQGPIGYTAALTEYVIEHTGESGPALAQTDEKNQNYDILTGLPFFVQEQERTEEEKAAEITEYFRSLNETQKAALYTRILSTPSEEYVQQSVDEYMSRYTTREEMENMIASAYGTDADSIREYLTAYSDEEIEKMIREQLSAAVTAAYAEQAQQRLAAIAAAPDAEELSPIIDGILQQLSTRMAKEAYVNADWTGSTTMTPEAAALYLASLSDEELDRAVYAAATKQATALYAENAAENPAGGSRKLAAAFDAEYLTLTDPAALAALYDGYMPSGASESTLEENLALLGVADRDVPSSISIYPDTFEDKDKISDLIEQYNRETEEENQISYTDYMALLMSGVTDIIDAVSYGLIAFVSISLIVSSIMIGIITYISVLERTKEIGILRSIGASKKDISRVFNAETLIIGFAAGVLGILVSLVCCLPINLFIRVLSGVSGIHATLPVAACLLLVLISMGLTLVAGLFPSGVAARKDPVEALRTE